MGNEKDGITATAMTSLPAPAWHPRFLVGFLFTLSGACALVYQLAWVRRFTLEFGSTSLAVASVVAVFMGGLAWGAAIAGRHTGKIRQPLATYGTLECLLAFYAAASLWTFPWALQHLSVAATYFSDSFAWLAVMRVAAAAILILPPTLLMGASLPILSAWVERQRTDHRQAVARLYGLNTLGAMAGVLVGGFVFLPHFGMQAAIIIAAAANVALGVTCITLSRKCESGCAPKAAEPARRVPHPAPASASTTRTPGLATSAAIVALAGAGAMACQVLWTRVASLVLGGSAYSFTIVLATFLAGLGLGAVAAAMLIARLPRHTMHCLWVMLAASASAVCLSGWLMPMLPLQAIHLHHTLGIESDGSRSAALQLLLAAALLFPPTLLFGATFPTALAALSRGTRLFSSQVGSLYAWNTAGCIAGVLVGGFILLPWLGPRGGVLAAAGALLAAGVLLSWSVALPRRAVAATAALAALGVFGIVFTPAWDRHLMTSGPHSYAANLKHLETSSELSRHLRETHNLLFYADGLTATITVTSSGPDDDPRLLISTDGKIDGSSHFDMPTQRLQAHLPLLLHPAPRDIGVIGMGTGSTAGSASLHPETRVRVVEIERRMVDGSRLFAEHNHGVHERENVEIIVTDGRLHLLTHREAYDVIISVPSNPWLAGASDLFTADFFHRASGSLRDGGIFAQWIQLYGLSHENLRVVLRGFLDAFPQTYLATTIVGTDILLLGTRAPLEINVEAIDQRMAGSAIAADLADPRVNVVGAAELLSHIRMTPEQTRAFAGVGPRHTDNHPILAYRAARDLHRDTGPENEAAIARLADGVATRLTFPDSLDPSTRLWHVEALAHAYQQRFPDNGESDALLRVVEPHQHPSQPQDAQD